MLAAAQARGSLQSEAARRISQALPRWNSDGGLAPAAPGDAVAALEAALQQLERHMEKAHRCCLLTYQSTCMMLLMCMKQLPSIWSFTFCPPT